MYRYGVRRSGQASSIGAGRVIANARRFRISFAAHPATMSRRLTGDQHNQEQSCQAMKLRRAIAAIVPVSAFAAPVAAGTVEDAVGAHARGDSPNQRTFKRYVGMFQKYPRSDSARAISGGRKPRQQR